MSQRTITFTVLRENANAWVSAAQLVDAGAGWRYAARIYDLRQAGHTIEERPDPGTSRLAQYRLRVDVAPGQVALGLVA